MMPAVDMQCPYCGESITLLVDDSVDHQRYIEDCQVCCRPISVDAWIEDGDARVSVTGEND